MSIMMQTCFEQLEIDTKDLCLLCLGSRIDIKCFDSPPTVPSLQGLKQLLRYLKVSPKELFNCSSEFLQSMEIREDINLKISLCSGCSSVTEKFYRLYQDYELIQLQFGNCVQSLHESIRKGNENPERVRKYKDQMRPTNSSDLVNASIAANLRNETLKKCSLKLRSGTPRVQVVSEKAKPSKTGGVEDCSVTIGSQLLNNEKFSRRETRSLKTNTSQSYAEYKKISNEPKSHEIDVVAPQAKSVARKMNRRKGYFSSIRKKLKAKSQPNAGGKCFRGVAIKICEYCKTRYSTNDSLRTHTSLMHPERLISQFLPSHVSLELCKQGICAVWEEMFKVSRTTCQICKMKFTQNPNLKRHLTCHHAEEFAVTVLERIPSLPETAQSPDLTKENIVIKEINLASGKHKFACEYCKICNYTSIRSLRQHMCYMHPEHVLSKLFPPHIPMDSRKQGVDAVLERLFQQTSESGFTCKYCTTNIVQKRSFKLHVVVMHAQQLALEAQQCIGLTEHLEAAPPDALPCSSTWSKGEYESSNNPTENNNESDGLVEMDFEIDDEKNIKIENPPPRNVDLHPLDIGELD